MLQPHLENNNQWINSIKGDDQSQRIALSNLREKLIHNLRSSFAGSKNIDDSFIEDVAQESIIVILQRLDQFEGRSRFITWATSIAIRVAMTNLRRKYWSDISLDQYLESSPEVSDEPDRINDQEVNQERNNIIKQMMLIINSALTSRQRQALLAELNGVPQEEIARRLEMNRNAVYKLTHDARKRLKRELQNCGYGNTEIQFAFQS